MIKEERASVDRSMANATRWIWVTFQRAGFHYYPAAISDQALADVNYLGNRHRHLFKFTVQIQVTHNDRDLEFHQVLNVCESLMRNTIDINHKSVEMLADDLFLQLAIRYPNRKMKISVSEDGECGCTIEYPANEIA